MSPSGKAAVFGIAIRGFESFHPNVLIEIFPDEGIGIQILENVRGRGVFVLQTIARHPNPYLIEAIEESAIEKMFVTNTIPFPKGLPRKIRSVSVAPLFAKAIEAIAGAKSIFSLFQ